MRTCHDGYAQLAPFLVNGIWIGYRLQDGIDLFRHGHSFGGEQRLA